MVEQAVPQDVLVVDNLSVSYGDESVLNGVSLALASGESCAVMGRSGSGKSSLISCIMRLLRPQNGRILFEGTDTSTLNARDLTTFRRAIGVVPQFGDLFPELTALDNVALAAVLGGINAQDAEARARRLLERLAVPISRQLAGDLSGGERQRVALARALIVEPRLIVADEPTGSLDVHTRDEVADLLFSAPREWGCALMVTTHDSQVAARADRVYLLGEGSFSATPEPLSRRESH